MGLEKITSDEERMSSSSGSVISISYNMINHKDIIRKQFNINSTSSSTSTLGILLMR